MYYDFNDNSLLGKLDRKFGRYGFKYLTIVILVGMAIVGVLDYALLRAGYYPLSSLLWFDKELILSGEVWRIITFVFVPESSLNPIFLVFYLYFFYLMGTSLSREWGDFRFNVYYLIGYLGTLGFGFITGYASTYYLNLTLFLAFAILNPNVRMLLFYFIPIKIKWLALADCVLLLIDLIIYPLPYKIAIIISLVNVVLFFWRYLFYAVKNFFRRRKYNREMKAGYKEYEKQQMKALKKARKAKIRVVKDDEFYPNQSSDNTKNENSNDDLFGF